MAYPAAYLCRFKQSITFSSVICRVQTRFCVESETLKALRKEFYSSIHSCSSSFLFRFASETRSSLIFGSTVSGRKISKTTILGATVGYGSITLFPHISYAMDGEHNMTFMDDQVTSASYANNEERALWRSARKLWIPILFLLTVMGNLNHPLILIMIKTVLFLLSTKPSPLSVYIFVDQICHHSEQQRTHLCQQKSLYASKVEVQDYMLLCLARVEVREEKFRLLGILGGWWVLPLLTSSVASSSKYVKTDCIECVH